MNDLQKANGLRGNPNLRLPDAVELVSQETAEWRTKEIARCIEDHRYFAENYFHIIDLDKGVVVLKPYPKQQELLDTIFSNRKTICLASRQSGKTTAYTVLALHIGCFESEKKILICANKESTAIGILKRIKKAYELLPSWLKPGIVVWNEKNVVFSNGCEIMALATASDAARSYSCLSGETTIDIRFGSTLYKNLKISDLADLVEKEKKQCGCHWITDTNAAIEFCEQAVDIGENQ